MLPDAIPIPATVRLRRAVRRLDTIVYRLIQERRNSNLDRGDLMSLLLQVRDEDDGSGMSDRQVRDEVMTMVLAGHETTALALTWAWYLLSLHPAAETRFHEELDSVLGDRVPQPGDLARLAYTRNLVDETLRLYPPAWAIERASVRPTSVGGHQIGRDVSFIFSAWTVQRDERWFSQPLAFSPERWAGGELLRRLPRFAYFPFGGGPRQCIGNTFALSEAVLILAAVGQRYRLRLVEGQQVHAAPTITLRPNAPIRMRLERRTARTSPSRTEALALG
jgi:cytochrome P450